jgi:hypothetical protein
VTLLSSSVTVMVVAKSAPWSMIIFAFAAMDAS